MSEYLCTGRGFSYEGCNDCKGVRSSKGRLPAAVRKLSTCTCNPRWVLFTKRTDDPKLAWIEHKLHDRGLPSRRNGDSFHAPILEVHEADHDRAWETLNAKHGRRRIDDLPDDHRMFAGYEPLQPDPEEYEQFDPIRDGWVDKNGRP